MPPFLSGLRKRKREEEPIINTTENIPLTSQSSSDEVEEEEEKEDLIKGLLDAEGDATDSDADEAEACDMEQDGVLFGNDDDSTLGVEKAVVVASDVSSELTDSESDDESAISELDETESDSSDNSDSGQESGLGHTNSSDDSTEENTKSKNKKQLNTGKGKGPIEAGKGKLGPKDIGKGKKVIDKHRIEDDKNLNDALVKLQKQIEDSHIDDGKDEYESGDTSDEEERRNTVGDIPMWWYNEYPHVGYDLDGRRIIKPPQRDTIDEFLKKCEDPDFWRTVKDPSTGQDVVLSKSDLELIARIKESKVPNAEHNEYEPWVEWFSREVLATPLRAFPEHKRSFLPSKSEQQQISKLVHALKMGWIKTRKQLADERRKKKEKNFYNLWGSSTNEEEEKLRGIHKHIPAPKRPLPGHAESYNPPPEYLLDTKEMKEWNKLSETPWKRKYTFLPMKHKNLREVPAYERFIRERFLRCLDLYLAPRAIKMKLTISPEDLVPKLPSPRDLQPFPTSECVVFKGHTGLVRSCDFDPSGQYAVSGSDDGSVKIWETGSGRCLRTIYAGEPVARVAWTPAAGLSLVAVAVGNRVLLLNPGADIGAHKVAEATDQLLEEPPPNHDVVMDERTNSAVNWDRVKPEEWVRGVRVAVTHFKPVIYIAWHGRGDYLAVTLQDGASRAVIVHQLSRRRSQVPFAKAKGLVQCAIFHPSRPFLFVATQRVVRIYDLVKQELVKKLLTGAQWISNIAAHPAGDNVLISSYDRKCIWFDLDMSSKPYQSLRLHGGAVRSVAFHKRYPLFATAGDDPYIVVSHGMVYNDLLQNPLIVPLKQLKGPPQVDSLCVTDVKWHPTQPWLLASAADHTMRMYS